MTALSNYWPTLANIDQCIRTEAETVDAAVLLAVHEPGPLVVRAASGASEEWREESDLLRALLHPADDGSAVVVAITGQSGVGKSHMIRWLHAQLHRSKERDRLVVVLIPKTASLRQVVERILEPLTGGLYEELKTDLARAVDALSPGDASALLATALAIELGRKYDEGLAAIRSNSIPGDRDTRRQVADAGALRDLLRDPTVIDKWLGQHLLRIVKQAIEGGNESDSGQMRRFTPEDLEAPAGWDSGPLSAEVRRAVQRLQADDGAGRFPAAAVLQDALDPALRMVFRFSEALGQRTIEEIVDQIRRRLLVEDKELVLLIEDFAALSGIQQPLLNLMIAESDHQGRRVRAPLRTALAVTDGFLPSRQTILTRAKREWIIPNTASDDEQIVRRFVALAGRYLNAARWGVNSLRDQYAQSAKTGTHDWVKRYSEPLDVEEADMLMAFGESEHGHPLFPLSQVSINALCHRELRTGNRLNFNPRAFINSVLRDTLLLRPLYEKKAFPPEGFKEAVLHSEADRTLHSQALSASEKRRLVPVLVYWGGNPNDLGAQPVVAKDVFKAFSLPWPYRSEGARQPVKPTPGGTTGERPVSPPPPVIDAPRETAGLAAQIEAWASGSLTQEPARRVRTILVAALNERLDWNGLRLHRNPLQLSHIWLPYAPVGNPTTEPRIVIGEEIRPVPFRLRAAIKALDRWDCNQRSWNYKQSEDDYASAQGLLDAMEAQAISWLTALAQRQAAVAVRTLHRQSLLLRRTNRAEPPTPSLSDYFSADGPSLESLGSSQPSPLAAPIVAATHRALLAAPKAQRYLLESIACFQGTGTTPYAIDPSRVQAAWKSTEAESDAQLIRSDEELRSAASELAAGRLPVLLNRYRTAANDMVPRLRTIVGREPELALSVPIRTLVDSARKCGLLSSGFAMAEVDRALELLADELTKSATRRAVAFSEPDAGRSVEFQLAAWASIDMQLLDRTVEALSLLDASVQDIERNVGAELKISGVDDVEAIVASLKVSFQAVMQEVIA